MPKYEAEDYAKKMAEYMDTELLAYIYGKNYIPQPRWTERMWNQIKRPFKEILEFVKYIRRYKNDDY